ncbi:MAG: hypothetical protein IKX48_06535, partial [Victivallales bacterium]|nr:hypothetical protein [Victivallales bacterium]
MGEGLHEQGDIFEMVACIFLNFFTDDYEKHHDNLWKVSVTADVKSAEQYQSLFDVLWLVGMRPW